MICNIFSKLSLAAFTLSLIALVEAPSYASSSDTEVLSNVSHPCDEEGHSVNIACGNHRHHKMKSEKAFALQTALRKLSEDHIIWTRLVIISTLSDLADKEAATKRLLQNQVDLGNAIEPYYGKDAAAQFTKLLTDHILIANEILVAAKAGDNTKVQSESAKWMENGDQIATFLSKANTHWSYQEMKTMFSEHLNLTTEEIKARLEKNWDKDVLIFEKIHENMLAMADMLANGIVKAFPDKFKH